MSPPQQQPPPPPQPLLPENQPFFLGGGHTSWGRKRSASVCLCLGCILVSVSVGGVGSGHCDVVVMAAAVLTVLCEPTESLRMSRCFDLVPPMPMKPGRTRRRSNSLRHQVSMRDADGCSLITLADLALLLRVATRVALRVHEGRVGVAKYCGGPSPGGGRPRPRRCLVLVCWMLGSRAPRAGLQRASVESQHLRECDWLQLSPHTRVGAHQHGGGRAGAAAGHHACGGLCATLRNVRRDDYFPLDNVSQAPTPTSSACRCSIRNGGDARGGAGMGRAHAQLCHSGGTRH